MAARCKPTVEQAAGRPLTDREMADLLSALQRRVKEKRAEAKSRDEAVLLAADQIAKDATLAALIEKRNAALNLRRKVEAVDFVTRGWADKPVEGIEALLVGVNRARQGARASVAADQRALAGKYLAGFIADVERLGDQHMHLLADGAMDLDIARALWAKDNPGGPAFTGPKEADDIATVVAKWQEVARLDANREGAWIGKLPGYVVRQSHDQRKITAAGREAWKKSVLPLLDMGRTMDAARDADDFLDAVYDGLASGVHLKSSHAQPGEKAGGFKGAGNLARRVSQERVLHFKDADAWFTYNQQFGSGSLRESLLSGLDRMANATALMHTLGTNPAGMLDQIIAEAEQTQRGNVEGLRKLNESRKMLDNRLAEVDGRTRIPVSAMLARFAAGARAIESMAKLGGAVISAVTDVPVYASEMRYQGKSMLGGMLEAIRGLGKGRGTKEQREILAGLGVFFDSMRGELTSRFSAADDVPGTLSRLQNAFFKLNGLSLWTDTMRASAALSMSHTLARTSGKGWGDISDELRRVLSLYGLDAGKWDIARGSAQKQADGRAYLTPDSIEDLPDDAFVGYLRSAGMEPTPARIRELRNEIAAQVRSYILDRADYAVITPDARTRAVMRQGTQPGTPMGELARFIGQFKAFPIAVMQKAMGRELYGRGTDADTLGRALRSGNGEFHGMAQLIVWTTLFGYGAMVVKDLLKLREPRPPDEAKTWLAAAAQGGGFGIYADFLFGEANRTGGGPLATLAGPVLGAADDLIELWQRVRDGDDAAAAALRLAVNNAPFLNLFYTRLALDYAILYRVQEALNPGYLRRMERRVQQENNQNFIVRPSEAVR